MTKRNTAKPVRVVSPIMEEQEKPVQALYKNGLTRKKQSPIFYLTKEKKKESTSPIKVSRTVLSKIRYSANANSIHPN